MDLNNDITYKIKICVIDIVPKYFEAIQTSFLLKVPKNVKKASIQVFGLTKELVVNPRCSNVISCSIENNGVYECSYSDTLRLLIGEEDIDTDTGYLDCTIKCGPILIPLQIQDDLIKPVELTGIGAFKWKYHEKRSLEYREGKIVSGTTEFFTKEPYRSSLATENEFIQNGWLAIADTIDGEKEYILDIPNSVKSAYIKFLEEFKNKRILPSLAYYKDRLQIAANNYVKVVEALFEQIPAGQSLTPQQNNVLLLGCVIKSYDERTISMSPLHPLNVLYQGLIRFYTLDIILHNLDAVFIFEIDTCYLIEGNTIPETDQTYSLSAHVIKQVCNCGLSTGHQNTIWRYFFEQM